MATHRSRTVSDTRRGGRPRWRKRLARGVVCLVLGAVTTVGVAWWMPAFDSGTLNTVICSGGTQSVNITVLTRSVEDFSLVSVARSEWYEKLRTTAVGSGYKELADASAALLPVEDLSGLPLLSAAPEWIALPPLPRADVAQATIEDSIATTTRRGWPWRALESRTYHQDRWVNQAKQTVSSRTVGQVWIGGTALPVKPIFAGLALDTLFYAIPCWFIFATPGAVTRWRRRRRGRCIGCGYELAGLAVENGARTCPECGALDRARCAMPAES